MRTVNLTLLQQFEHQVEQRPHARFAFVLGDDGRLGGTARQDGVAPRRRVAFDDGEAVVLKPMKERGIVDQPVFHHLGITGQQLAFGQGPQHPSIGQHQARLMEAAHQVLALGRVDTGLAADRAVDLGQQGGRNLHEIEAAQQDRGGETDQIAPKWLRP